MLWGSNEIMQNIWHIVNNQYVSATLTIITVSIIIYYCKNSSPFVCYGDRTCPNFQAISISESPWIFWSTQILIVNPISKQGISPMYVISASMQMLCIGWRGVWPLPGADSPAWSTQPWHQGTCSCQSAAGWNQHSFALGEASLESWHVIVHDVIV